MNTAVLFLSHLVDDSTISKYKKLQRELGMSYDVFWVFQRDNEIDASRLVEENVRLFTFTLKELSTFGYLSMSERLYGSEHFITCYFYKSHPEYSFYWIIEYDVVFTGNWNTLFMAFADNDADMLSSHVDVKNESNSEWCWWGSLSSEEEYVVEDKKLVKAFNPVYRLSRKALDFLDTYLQHNLGFYEVIVSTALYNNGFQIEDIGGTGPFVAEANRNKFYVQGSGINNGTMRWRPDFSAEEIMALGTKDKLFHPLKRESLD